MLDQLNDALQRLDASIEAMLPPHEALKRRQKIEEEKRIERQRVATVTKECALAIERLAYAVQYPRTTASDINEAIEHCRTAMAAAPSGVNHSSDR